MPRLSLYCFGVFQATLDNERLTNFHSVKVQALLAYLALEADHPHPRETLATLLWPLDSETSARNSLRQALYELRKLLGDRDDSPAPFLLVNRQTVQFNQASDYRFDVADFLTHLKRGHLAEAAACYRAELLSGLSCESEPFEEWLRQTRAHFHNLAVDLFDKLTEQKLSAGELAQARSFAQRQLALEPWREEAHRQLMTALALTGERSAALAQYETCRRILTDELGVEPDAETTALYEQIKAGKLSGAPAPRPIHPISPPLPQPIATEVQTIGEGSMPRHNLPPQPTPFIGRKTDLAQMNARISDPACRLLTIVGPGGMGKTRLAIQTVQQILEAATTSSDLQTAKIQNLKCSDGVFFVSLAGVGSPDLLISAIATALDFTFYGSADLKTQLLAHLQSKTMLLLLDNCEHLLDGIELVSDLLAAAPNVKVLATSREPLNLREEWLHLLHGMSFPADETSPAPLDSYTAVQLFVQRARQLQPTFDLANEGQAVARICRLAEGMPLAIELAATWLRFYPCVRVGHEMAHNLDFLATRLRNVAPRHRSMRAVFEHSWSLLSSEEQQVLCHISVFRAGCTLDAAMQVTGAARRLLLTLVEKSLLQLTPTRRLQFHELLRQLAAEKLAQQPEIEAMMHQRHSLYYTALLHQNELALKGAQQQAALAAIDTEIENIHSAWAWAVDCVAAQPISQALESLSRFYEWYSRYPEGESACQTAVQVAIAANDPHLQVRSLTWQARFNQMRGQPQEALRLLQQSLALLDAPSLAKAESRRERATVLLGLGRLARDAGDSQVAQRYFEQSRTLYQAIDERWGMAKVLNELCWVVRNLGPDGTADQLRARLKQAEELAQQSLTICQEIGDQAGLADGFYQLGITLRRLARFDEAATHLEQAISRYQALGIHSGVVMANTQLSFVTGALGKYKQAEAQAQLALNLAGASGYREAMGLPLLTLGLIALVSEEYKVAQQYFHEMVTIGQNNANRLQEAIALAGEGYAYRGLGEVAQARRDVCAALAIGIAIRQWDALWNALPLVALLLLDRGEIVRAVELYTLLLSFKEFAASRRQEDLVGRKIAAIVATLPPAVVAEAQARGQARELWATAQEFLNEIRQWS